MFAALRNECEMSCGRRTNKGAGGAFAGKAAATATRRRRTNWPQFGAAWRRRRRRLIKKGTPLRGASLLKRAHDSPVGQIGAKQAARPPLSLGHRRTAARRSRRDAPSRADRANNNHNRNFSLAPLRPKRAARRRKTKRKLMRDYLDSSIFAPAPKQLFPIAAKSWLNRQQRLLFDCAELQMRLFRCSAAAGGAARARSVAAPN